MGKTLILTEKPSVGRDFAKALGCNQKGDGHIEGANVVVTWAFGHLLESAPPDAYNPMLKDWRFDTLPIIPDEFRFVPIKDGRKQLSVVAKLLNRKDIDSVVIATDAGREGEVIARLILNYAGCRKKVYRFWTSQALSPEIIQYGMRKGLKSADDFNRIWQAGYQRTMADWLVGMNLSRCATIKMGGDETYSVGRVQTAVLALLVDRLRQRDNFVPEPYWVFRCTFENQKGQWDGIWYEGDGTEREMRFWNKADAHRVASKVNGKQGQVTQAKKERRKTGPPQLYSLTVLQREANRAFGFTAQQTLDTAQALYERHQAISYPRTDSQVLGSQNVDMAKNLANKLSRTYPDLFRNVQSQLFSTKNKHVFNDAKLTDHHALIPLKPAPAGLNGAEQKIYDMILTRFAAAFHPDYEYEATEIITTVEGETFLTRGNVTLKMGWRELYIGSGQGDNDLLPPLQQGDPARIAKMDGEEKKTTPPAEYTEDSLLNDMSNPAKYVEEESLKKIYRGDVGLGTQATRAQTIETLLKRQYAARDKKKIVATGKGCALIDYLRKMTHSQVLASPMETAKWEQQLNMIELGDHSPRTFEGQIRQFVDQAVAEFKNAGGDMPSQGEGRSASVGKCPDCGADIVETPKSFKCSNSHTDGCQFIIWKTVASRRLDNQDVVMLLDGKETQPMDFVNRQKKMFKARLKLVKEQDSWKTQFVFDNAGSNEEIGKCPVCGGDIQDRGKAYSCSNWKTKGCKFVVWKTMCKKIIDPTIVRELLEKGRTMNPVQGFKSKAGKNFAATLILNQDNGGQMGVSFDFG